MGSGVTRRPASQAHGDRWALLVADGAQRPSTGGPPRACVAHNNIMSMYAYGPTLGGRALTSHLDARTRVRFRSRHNNKKPATNKIGYTLLFCRQNRVQYRNACESGALIAWVNQLRIVVFLCVHHEQTGSQARTFLFIHYTHNRVKQSVKEQAIL